MKFACLARFFNPYSKELKFAIDNNFDFMQLWYDENGLTCYEGESIENIKNGKFETIIHAVLDIHLIKYHIDKLIECTNYINSKDLIIHPILKSYEFTSGAIEELIYQMNFLVKEAYKFGITVHLENNSMLDPIFCSIKEYKHVFSKVENLEFLIDLAHINSYDELFQMTNIKYPKILHIADRNKDIIHEHLKIGQGDFEFKKAFSESLREFDGSIILELLKNDDVVSSKEILLELLSQVYD